jgi:alkylation response protein AidB-like acyl-CoA dehydrogenase
MFLVESLQFFAAETLRANGEKMRQRLIWMIMAVAAVVPAFGGPVPILGSDLSTFAILGGGGVAINGTASVITGSVGACCVAVAVTGTIPTNFSISGGTVQMGGTTAAAAQGELVTAMTALSNMGLGANKPSLGG